MTKEKGENSLGSRTYLIDSMQLQDLEKAQWYLNRLVKEVKHGKS